MNKVFTKFIPYPTPPFNWNILPFTIHVSETMSTFKYLVKLQLFNYNVFVIVFVLFFVTILIKYFFMIAHLFIKILDNENLKEI